MFGDAIQTQSRGHGAAGGDAVGSEPGILGAQPEGVAEGTRVLHGAHQHVGVGNGDIGLREGDAAGFGQLGHFGQDLALEPDGDGAQRIDVCLVELARAVLEHFDQARFVQDGVGVGRQDEAGDAASERGVHFGFEGGAVFEAGFAQTGGQVDEAGQHGKASRVDDPVGHEPAGRRC